MQVMASLFCGGVAQGSPARSVMGCCLLGVDILHALPFISDGQANAARRFGMGLMEGRVQLKVDAAADA